MLSDEQAARIKARAGELAADCERWSTEGFHDNIANELAALVDELLDDRKERESQRAELLALCKAALDQWPESMSFELRDRMEAAVAEGREVSPSPPGG